MDPKYKNIIEEYRNLISKNLIITEDFYRVLITHGVFTDGLIKEIKRAPRGENQKQLIDMLMTRTNVGFGKFCDVLEVTGHHFLSDCLREAENHESTESLDVNDMLSKVPFISKAVKNDQQKEALQKYFRDKIHNEVIKQTWRGDMATKERLMVTRQQQIEQVWHYEEENKIKDKSILDLQKDYMQLQTHADDIKREIKSLHKHIEDLNRKHREDLQTQVRFNMANDRHLTRLNERAEDAGSYLMRIHDVIRELMGENYTEQQAKTVYQNLEQNFLKFVKTHTEIRDLNMKFREERVYMSNQVAGVAVKDAESLKPHFQRYIVNSEEAKAQLEEKVVRLESIIEETKKQLDELKEVQAKMEALKANEDQPSEEDQYANLKQEIARSTATIGARDEKIQGLQMHVKTLAMKIKDLEAALAEAEKNERQARLAVQNIPKPDATQRSTTQTPPKAPANLAPIANPPRSFFKELLQQQLLERQQSSYHYKKPTTTQTTKTSTLQNDMASLSSLDAIKGQGLAGVYPAGVKRLDDGVMQTAMRQPSTVNGSQKVAKLAPTRGNRRF